VRSTLQKTSLKSGWHSNRVYGVCNKIYM